MQLPSWVSSDETKPAPMPLLRVQSFINTRDIESGADQLLELESGRAWLAAAGLITTEATVSAAQLRAARSTREALRALVKHNGSGTAPTSDDLRPLQSIAGSRGAAVRVDLSGRIQLGVGDATDLRGGLLGLLLTIGDAQADGTWSRLKLCANTECEWAFFDRSRNRQGSWCTMAICGNRLKNRRFRSRQQPVGARALLEDVHRTRDDQPDRHKRD